MKDLKYIAKIFKALSHPTRLELYQKILQHLEVGENFRQEEHTCFLHNICEGFKIGAPTMSHHLKELANVGLITTEREGKFLVCKANPNILDEVLLELHKKEGK